MHVPRVFSLLGVGQRRYATLVAMLGGRRGIPGRARCCRSTHAKCHGMLTHETASIRQDEGNLRVIPATDPMSGYLPVGRYTCTLEEVQRVFVEDSQFAGSVTRRKLFAGLVRYMAEWERLEDMVGTSDVLRRIWVGGSFTTAKLDPDDVDVSPILDGPKLDAIKGKPGCGKISKLFGNRESVVRDFGVEPFPVTWWPVTTMHAREISILEHDYVLVRGLMDDFWQRVRSSPVKGPLTVADSAPRRGYLEVIRDGLGGSLSSAAA